jgi:hypothetical protein
MRLRLFARLWRPGRPRSAHGAGPGSWTGPPGDPASPDGPAGGRHRRPDGILDLAGQPPPGGGQPPPPVGPLGSPVTEAKPRRARGPRTEAARGTARRAGSAKAAVRVAARTRPEEGAAARRARERPAAAAKVAGRAGQPWYEVAPARLPADGRRDCGPLEQILCREWAESTLPPPELVRAIDRLAELPARVKEMLAAGLDAIFIGPGGVPSLDDMSRLRGLPLPSGRATWDACAGAYGERKIIVGSRPSAAPDVMCHEVGHALDDIDGSGGGWQSDSDEFRGLYDRCLPRLVSDFHRQPGTLGRREFFADAFAAIASRQRPALVDMLGGDTRTALDVMLYFNVRYGI